MNLTCQQDLLAFIKTTIESNSLSYQQKTTVQPDRYGRDITNYDIIIGDTTIRESCLGPLLESAISKLLNIGSAHP
jgi:hypothetical protein